MPIPLRPLLLLIVLVAAAPAWAREDVAPAPTQREDAGDRVRAVERDGGRVLQAEPMQRGGRQVYRLKVLTPEGRVRVLPDAEGQTVRQPAREARLDPRDRGRPGAVARDRPRTSSPEPAADDAPRSPRRDDDRRERD